jgi:hypothetical protein
MRREPCGMSCWQLRRSRRVPVARYPGSMRRAGLGVLVCLLVSCAPAGAGPGPKPASPVAAAPPGPSAERLAFWRDLHARGDALPAGADVAALALELVGYLGSIDPEVRDGLAYEVLAAWIEKDGLLTPDSLRRIEAALLERLRAPAGAVGDDTVFGRSFAALVLAEIAARDAGAPVFTDGELTALVGAARAYAGAERDLRGHVAGRGWAHAAAHTSDWLKFLARNPRLGRARGQQVLDAILDLAVRRHGQILCHGEDGRMAQPILDLLRRGHIDAAAFSAWLDRLLAPLREKAGPAFDPGLYAAQRNARNLAFTLFVQLSLEDGRSPLLDAALAALSTALRG